MVDSLGDSVLIVDLDIADARQGRPNIDKDQRYLAETQTVEKRLLHAERENRNPLDAALQHAANRRFHAFGIVNGRGQQNFIAVCNGSIFESLDDLGKEWIRDLGNN